MGQIDELDEVETKVVVPVVITPRRFTPNETSTRHEVYRHRSVDVRTSRYSALPSTAYVPKVYSRLYVSDHFNLSMLSDEVSALEQTSITKLRAEVMVKCWEGEIGSFLKSERTAAALSDITGVKLRVDVRPVTRFLVAGDVVLFVEETDKGVAFWKLSILKQTGDSAGRRQWQ